MKFTTTKKHSFTVKQDLQRWDALAEDMAAFVADLEEEQLASYVRSHEKMLRGLDLDLLGVDAVAGRAILMWVDHIEYIRLADLSRREITLELIGTVMREAVGV